MQATATLPTPALAGGLLVSALALCATPAQEPDIGITPITQEEIDGGSVVQIPVPDTQQEMARLFGEVERNLYAIDALLYDAGAGDTSALAGISEAGIDRLLRDSVDTGRDTLGAIDRILELAAQGGT
ncbi:MAG: hypothetical protein CMJ84_11635 [Planctomycetes bacterium]|jgi:hypothetical protein|nr:hypothetical protein [Planctomycetota bacterium]MDP6407847.1 hypothetical protein [Planctomycetota bacterium]